ncbi:MAG: membrane-bound lytic murein transglycosylase MltF [Rhodocyclaceae bacterium]|nr:MAG: membrane-bound lytic murein transglycosylase MltF [Rhodocyclaceae bacterium]
MRTRSRLALLLTALTGLLVSSCGQVGPPEKTGELVVALVASPTTYQVDEGGVSGFEYDVVNAFAESQGLRVRYVLTKDREETIDLVKRGKAHFAAGISIDDQTDLIYTPPLRRAEPVLVKNADDLSTEDGDLDGKEVTVSAGSQQSSLLRKMAGEAKRFMVTELSGIPELTLLEQLAERHHVLVATDSLLYALAARSHPELEVAEKLPGKLDFAWAFAKDATALADKARDFITGLRRDGGLARVQDRYFGYISRINTQGISDFIEALNTDLTHLRKLFQDAQEITGIDWRLLAALSYQESKWDPLATSPTGVRGLMMLTEDTADRLRVNNRLDPKQSILAGAKYLADLRDTLPDTTLEPDRTWLALAAYNLGMGHLNGGRAIAQGLGKDADSWYEMKTVLPLMAQPKYYARLKSGRARGGEAVIMVENIRTYYDILKRFEAPWIPPLKFKQR